MDLLTYLFNHKIEEIRPKDNIEWSSDENPCDDKSTPRAQTSAKANLVRIRDLYPESGYGSGLQIRMTDKLHLW